MKTSSLEKTLKGPTWRERLITLIESMKRHRHSLELAIVAGFAAAYKAANELPYKMTDR